MNSVRKKIISKSRFGSSAVRLSYLYILSLISRTGRQRRKEHVSILVTKVSKLVDLHAVLHLQKTSEHLIQYFWAINTGTIQVIVFFLDTVYRQEPVQIYILVRL